MTLRLVRGVMFCLIWFSLQMHGDLFQARQCVFISHYMHNRKNGFVRLRIETAFDYNLP